MPKKQAGRIPNVRKHLQAIGNNLTGYKAGKEFTMSAMEIIMSTETKYSVSALNKCVQSVASIIKTEANNTAHLARLFADAKKLWDDADKRPADFETASDFFKSAFGLEKSAAYAMCAIGSRFIREYKTGKKTVYHSWLTPVDFVDFTTSKLEILSRIQDADIIELIDSGEISPTTSARDLREIVKRVNDEKKAGKKLQKLLESGMTEAEAEKAMNPEPVPVETVEIHLLLDGEEKHLVIPRKDLDKIIAKYSA